MSKKKKKPVQKPLFATAGKNEHFVPLYDDLVNSEAWLDLSSKAREVYLIIYQRYRGNYSGDTVICPYSEFNKFGIQNTTVSRKLEELGKHGFIKVERGTVQCSANNNLRRQPNRYKFLHDWVKWGKDENDTS